MRLRPPRPFRFQRRSRRGFTLLELLIVIAIVAILVSLLLPAVQQAREGVRRAQCKNNLRQLVVALAEYHDSFSTLPPGSTGTSSPVVLNPTESHFSWTVQILPFIEQTAIYSRIDFVNATVYADGDWNGDGTRDRESRITDWDRDQATRMQERFADNVVSKDELVDESGYPLEEIEHILKHGEPLPPRPDNRILYDETELGLSIYQCPSYWQHGNHSNYVGLHHHEPKPIGDDDSGLLFLNSSITYDDITDGRSVTAIFSETVFQAPINWASGTRSTLRYASMSNVSGSLVARSGVSVTPALVNSSWEGVSYDLPERFDTFGEALDAFSVSSAHSTAINVALMDGRVLPFNQFGGHEIFKQLVHRADAAPLEEF